jgi:hypothetical protein
MSDEPECAKLLTQTESSLRAIRLHLANYQRQLLRLWMRKPVEADDIPEVSKNK